MNLKSAIITSFFFIIGILTIYYTTRVEPLSMEEGVSHPTIKTIPKTSNEIVNIDEEVEHVNKVIKPKPTLQKEYKKREKVVRNIVDINDISSNDDAHEYLVEHSLKNVSPTDKEMKTTPRFSVYADITIKEAREKRNQLLPPSAPTMIQGSFPSGEQYNAIIDTDLKNNAKQIVVSNNQADGTITELAKVPVSDKQQSSNTQENVNDSSVVIAPPSIGQ